MTARTKWTAAALAVVLAAGAVSFAARPSRASRRQNPPRPPPPGGAVAATPGGIADRPWYEYALKDAPPSFDERLRRLLLTLSDAQWRRIGEDGGVGRENLRGEQRAFFNALVADRGRVWFPAPMPVDGDDTPPLDRGRRARLRLRLRLVPFYALYAAPKDEGGRAGLVWASENGTTQSLLPRLLSDTKPGTPTSGWGGPGETVRVAEGMRMYADPDLRARVARLRPLRTLRWESNDSRLPLPPRVDALRAAAERGEGLDLPWGTLPALLRDHLRRSMAWYASTDGAAAAPLDFGTVRVQARIRLDLISDRIGPLVGGRWGVSRLDGPLFPLDEGGEHGIAYSHANH